MGPCKAFFNHMGVTMPYVPESETERMHVIEQDAIFGTRDTNNRLYDIDAFVKEFLTEQPGKYVLIGTDKEELHYYVVTDKLALFVQLDTKNDTDTLSAELATLKYLLSAAAKVQGNRKFVIIHSDRRGDRFAWTQPNAEDIKWQEKPQDADNFLRAALHELKKQ